MPGVSGKPIGERDSSRDRGAFNFTKSQKPAIDSNYSQLVEIKRSHVELTPTDKQKEYTSGIEPNNKPTTIKVEKKEHCKPYYIREKEYAEARDRIFGPSDRIRKTRERYQGRKQTRFEIASSSIYEGPDTRIYLKIDIKGNKVEGLLDSGASVTCLGKDCLDLVEKAQLNIYPVHSQIRTADGRLNEIIGRVRADINFNGITKSVDFYLVPTLSFLCLDFMRAFNLLWFEIYALSSQRINP